MKHLRFLFFLFCTLTSAGVYAQKILPDITVKNFSGKIIVSWQNDFKIPVSDIFIQRSYDSLKNYTTIGTVLNPQSKENGYADVNPPYTKMYYRVSISFESGAYQISKPERPVRDAQSDSIAKLKNLESTRYPWQANPGADSAVNIVPRNEITYPSQRIYTAKDNSVIIHLADAASKKYTIKFFDDLENFLFELNKLNDEFLIIEKVNFGHAGWFHFEIYESGSLIEKNKFQILKDGKNGGR